MEVVTHFSQEQMDTDVHGGGTLFSYLAERTSKEAVKERLHTILY